MTVLQLQSGVIYGPVNSRRLGRSLGINLLPSDHKLCSFDCIYCHYGRTGVKTLFPEEDRFRSEEEILGTVEEALRTYRDIDYITFSGNGEPTLHPHFPTIVSEVRCLRKKLRPDVKMTILSNATTVHLPHIRDSLALFDAPIMKLDAGDPATLTRMNRPASGVALDRIIEGLKEIPGLIIQSLLINGKDGEVSNVRGGPYEAWLSALSDIKPVCVQIYSADRPVPEAGIERVMPSTLQHIAREAEERTGVPVSAYWSR
jgi:wyosine [tRNA(Phe)-imidazoG37] synthetase (radical SAM superfamily)